MILPGTSKKILSEGESMKKKLRISIILLFLCYVIGFIFRFLKIPVIEEIGLWINVISMMFLVICAYMVGDNKPK